MRKIFFTFLFSSLLTRYCLGGVHQEWVNRYSSLANKTNQAVAVTLASDGIVVGGSSTSTNGDLDYLVIKYSPSGAQAWLARYDSPTNGNDLLRNMTTDKTGNIVVTGTSKTAKFNSNGNLVWTAPFGGRAVASGTNGDIYVTGFSDINFATVKLNGSAGTNIWQTTYSSGYTIHPEISQTICTDNSENVFIAGSENHDCFPTICYQRIGVIKYNLNGLTMWHTNINPPFRQGIPAGMQCDQFGNLYVIGNDPFPFSTYDGTAKFDSFGNPLWFAAPVSSESAIGGMIVDQTQRAYITGFKNVGDHACYIIALATNGTVAWSNSYHGPVAGENRGNAITLDLAGNIYVAGYSTGSGTGNDIFTIKYDNNGNQLWVQRYDGPAHGDDIATGIVVDNETNVYVTGYSATTNGGTEFVTIKYSQRPALNIEKQPGGSMRLKVFADPGQVWAFQTTTNVLTDWQTIGTNTTNTNGVAQFDDTNTPPFPPRFYRGVSPP